MLLNEQPDQGPHGLLACMQTHTEEATDWRSLGSKPSIGLQGELNILYTTAPAPQ